MYQIPKEPAREIFRAYDIRGIAGKELDKHTVFALGRAIGSEVCDKGYSEVVVARDARLSSSELMAALQQGLLDCGLTVTDIGQVPTPVLYFSTFHLSIPCGIMLTASHNPAEYNGLKINIGGASLTQDHIMNLYARIRNQDFVAEKKGNLRSQNVLSSYIDRVCSDVALARPLKIVMDCGNGVAGMIAPQLFNRLGCEVIELYCDVDGAFPNHEADPSVAENLTDLQTKVLAEQADIGLAFDGDVDRIGVVSNDGEIIWPDRQLLLFSRDVLKRTGQGKIIFDIKCTSHLSQMIEQWGGQAIMSKTGHSFLKNKLREEKGLLAGEMSGHIFFKERWYGFDDGMYAAARLLEIISHCDDTVAEIFAQLPHSVSTPELKLPVPEEEKFAFLENFCRQADFPGAELITIDGLRVEFPFGWGLIRVSNTSPCLTLRFEADSENNLNKIQNLFRSELGKMDCNELPF